MNAKENYLNTILHKDNEWVPVDEETIYLSGCYFNELEYGSLTDGMDGFGVKWVGTESTGGNKLPDPRCPVLSADDIEDWEDIVKIPDPADYHWEEDAKEVEELDRSEKTIDYFSLNGPYERLAALMGFEDALIAMATEPEATSDLLEAIADYKIACMPYIAKYYNPDTYTLSNDVATQKNPFMSPETYRELISPQNKRIIDAAKEYGMIPIVHTCGHAEVLIEDFMNEGFEAWCSVQPCNDIAGLLDKYGDRFTIVGGYDTNGEPGMTGDPDVILADVERCWEMYGDKKGYIFSGNILNPDDVGGDIYASYGLMAGIAIDYTHKHEKVRA